MDKEFSKLLSHLPVVVPSFSEFKNCVQLYSGNLDVQEIRRVSKNFYVTYVGLVSDKFLFYVKNIRNKLAYGKVKYSEDCWDKIYNEIKEYVNAAYSYMKCFFYGVIQKI